MKTVTLLDPMPQIPVPSLNFGELQMDRIFKVAFWLLVEVKIMHAKHLSITVSCHGILDICTSCYCGSYFACGCDKNTWQKQRREGRVDFGSQFEGRQSVVERV